MELNVDLDSELPARLAVGRGTALFLCGSCFHPDWEIRRLELGVGERREPASAWAMPRPGALRAHPGEPRALRSGFWGAVTVRPREPDTRVEVTLAATLADGRRCLAKLGEIELADSTPVEEWSKSKRDGDRIAICMATFDPPAELFARQVESLRAQTHANWTCVVSDDCSDPVRVAQMRDVLGDDDRFTFHASTERLGFYRNFERALALAPPDAPLIALCDQDDRWHPDKLETLAAALGEAGLAYSDQRIVDPSGAVLAPSYWTRRRNNSTDFASLLVANTVTGAACLFRRELLELALPFPPAPGNPYHDHWLALVALASGGIAYVDRSLYDYVQHEDAQLGHTRANRGDPSPSRRFSPGWRAVYFYDYWRLRVFALTLLARCGPALSPDRRRVLERFLATEDSPAALAWLAARAVRPVLGLNETLGAERDLFGAVFWRRLVGLSRAPFRGPLSSLSFDASPPLRPGWETLS